MFESDKFLIGDYLVYPTHNKITLNEQEFFLEPKIMEVLCFFTKHPHQVISKQKVLDELWPGQTISHDVITRAIFELRKIFNDDAKNPTYFSTVTRKGYCFIHEVTAFEQQNTSAEQTTVKPDNRLTLLISLFVVVAVVAYISANLFIANSEHPIASPKNTTLISHGFEQVNQPSISPNGNEIAYIAESEGQYLLVKTKIDDLTKKTLSSSGNRLISPVWLDNETLAYAQCQKNTQCQVYKYHLPTSESTLLIDDQWRVRSLSINSEAQILLVIKTVYGERTFSAFDLNTTNEIEYDASVTGQFPVLDKTRQHVYLLGRTEQSYPVIQRFDLKSKQLERLAAKFDRVFSISSKAEGVILVSGRRSGESGIWQLNVDTQALTKVVMASPGEVMSDLMFNPTRNLLIYKRHKRNIDIGIEGLALDTRNVNSDMIDMNAVYAYKRDQLIFTSNRTGFYEVWASKNDQLAKLTQLKADVIERPILNKEQSKLAFTSRKLNETFLRILNIDDSEIEATFKFDSRIHLLNWHQNNKAIFYSASDDRRYAIYRFDFETQKSVPVVLDAGLLFQQRSDDIEYFGQVTSTSLMAKTANGEVNLVSSIPDSALPIRPHQLNIIGDSFYFADTQKGQRALVEHPLNSNQFNRLLTLPENAYVTQIGKVDNVFAIYDQLVDNAKQLVMVQLP